MAAELRLYRKFLSLVKIPRSLLRRLEKNSSMLTLENYMSYGLGSGLHGKVVTHVLCNNNVPTPACSNIGLLSCPQCLLVKYCSKRCKHQHLTKHRRDCQHPLLNPNWLPTWVLENRQPSFLVQGVIATDQFTHRCWEPDIAYDILQLELNEGFNRNMGIFKICYAYSQDIRNMVRTVNCLPKDYKGKCDFLLNNPDAIVLNRLLLILHVLLCPGPSVEESVEMTMHLMYSATLSEKSAQYLQHWVRLLYYSQREGMSFLSYFKTRGRGRIYSIQSMMDIKRPVEIFTVKHNPANALKSFRQSCLDISCMDENERFFSGLLPAHRMALNRYWDTGVLAPFRLSIDDFKKPNCLLFSSHGQWLGPHFFNPLREWDLSSVQKTGKEHGLDPSGDILGCLFFHIKKELREFASRMRDFDIDIHLTQYDPKVLCRGISSGAIPTFAHTSFDRIDLGNMVENIGIRDNLSDWSQLLYRNNPSACIVMHSNRWHMNQPNSAAQSNLQALGLLSKLLRHAQPIFLKRLLAEGSQSPSLMRLLNSLDVVIDHEVPFQRYLKTQGITMGEDYAGLRLRLDNKIRPKRYGVSLKSPQQKLPSLSKESFYNQFLLGGADFTARFIEFESF